MIGGQPLQIEWHLQPLNEQGVTVANQEARITNPLQKAQILLGARDELLYQDPLSVDMTVLEFFEYIQTFLHREINERLRAAEPELNQIMEVAAARQAVLGDARRELETIVHTLRIDLASKPEGAPWQPTGAIELTNWANYLTTQRSRGTYHQSAVVFETTVPAAPGPLRPETQVTKTGPPPSAKKKKAKTPRTQPQSPEERSDQSTPVDTPEPETGGPEGAGESGVAGAGGPPSDPGSDDSDNDPPPPRNAPRAEWRRYASRLREKTELLRRSKSQPAAQAPKQTGRVPDVDRFDGTPSKLDAFLRQLRIKFRIEAHKYPDDMIKISYAAIRLSGPAEKWYGQYCLKFDPVEQRRLGRAIQVDPLYATWDYFERALRTSFGQRLTRASYVREWDELKHTKSIDDFVDNLVRLMWLIGYEGAIVEDKIQQGLNEELGKQWSQLWPRPYHIADQLQLLRGMGQRNEDYSRAASKNAGKAAGAAPSGSGKKESSKNAEKASKKKEKRKEKKKKESGAPAGNPDWRDKETELKGISKEVRDARFKEDKCQKCGKDNHKWFECWTKEPVPGKAASSKKRGGGPADGAPPAPKKTKSSTWEGELRVAGGRIVEYPQTPSEDLDVWSI